MDPKGIVAFFPSDHHFSDDESFTSHIDAAYAATAARPEMIVLLGIPPETPEVEYGWIEPGVPLGQPVPDSVSRVSQFWEKPSGTLASQLMQRGCLWNSFVMVGYVQAFLNLIKHALPGLLNAFEAIRRSLFTAHERAAMRDLYSGIRSSNFSQDVLSTQTNCLAVLRATGLGWSDLGEPGRVLSVLERKGIQTDWGFTPGCGDEARLVRKSVAV
jgi:mannose-1-phosphate guanylyltransferase